MLGRAIAVSAIILGAALAGCIGQSDAPVVDDENANKTVGTGVVPQNATAAPDGRGDLAAFKETNATEKEGTGAMMHAHDYWKGETRKEIAYIDSGLIPFPLFPPDKPAGTAIADYDIPKPGLVYEGTDHLEVLLVYKCAPRLTDEPCVDHPQVTPMFDYLTAADEPGQFRKGGTLQVGTPFIIPVAPHEADMPHQTKSLWIFRIYSGEPTWWEFNITITAVKGNQVVNWPPHPDLYANSPERTVFDGPVHLESKGMIDANLYGTDAGWVNPERIISWGTDRVEVTVKDVRVTTQGGVVQPQSFLLEFHNASKPPLLGNGAQYGGRLVDEGTDGSTWHFVIDIKGDTDAYDTPYGTKSRWGFRFVPQFDNGGEACVNNRFLQQFLVGCQFVPWSIDYTMTVKAYGHPLGGGEQLPE